MSWHNKWLYLLKFPCIIVQGIADKSKIYISIGKLTAASPPIPQAKKPESDPLMAPLLKVTFLLLE